MRKKHTDTEIAAKLGKARELAEQGYSQRQIAGSLGVSVMTLYRWQKFSPIPRRTFGATGLPHAIGRLRRVAADLLLIASELEQLLDRRGGRRCDNSA
jgi:transcriptional regulator with XRE-family HTH domain